MAELQFEWDERKNHENQRKHGLSFEEAKTVFSDDNALLIADPDHSNGEERFLLLGLSGALQNLVVCHCYRHHGDVVRIISARKATRTEWNRYEQRRLL
jgi:uncharacterized DUF497 family protein